MHRFESPLSELTEYREFEKAIKSKAGAIQLTGCIDTENVFAAAKMAGGKKALYITCNDIKAAGICEDACAFGVNGLVYPSKDLLFYESDVRGNYFDKQRMEIIRQLILDDEVFAVTSVESLMERIAPLSAVRYSSIVIGEGDEIELDELEVNLTDMGYERYPQVDASGQFSVRGGIVDIYTLTEELPVRIELFGDTVDSIRSFDPETQRSVERLELVEVFPAGEIKVPEIQQVSLLEYFGEDSLIFAEEPARLLEKARFVADEYQEAVGRRIAGGMTSAENAAELFSVHEIFETLERKNVICLTGLAQRCEELHIAKAFSVQAQSVPAYAGQIETLISDLKSWMAAKSRVVLLSGSPTRAKRLTESLRDYEINAYCPESEAAEAAPGSVLVLPGSIHKGFAFPLLSYYVLSDGDLFGKKERRRRRKADREGRKITELSSLSVGDYVIHESYGLGRYGGTERKTISGISRDYMKISYGDGNMFLPVTQLNLVQKYADSSAEHAPRLNRLSGSEWSKTKAKVRRAVGEIAEDLVALYARRERASGMKYGEDTVWQKEFEEQFPYEETEDQLAAIEAVKQDMESGRVMDRLICGDVGFGKTEIAIRAAFKAVQDGRQVAYLVPTTILAQQHFNTFTQRLSAYPVTTELLCRFRSAAEQKKTAARLRTGETDIVIGTHRLLSGDIAFKNLGLLIIDEEQRFGVADKEKIKKLRENVDVLSLTATPIPRTLHMSLVGVRDMSILKEAPLDRVPIQTYVMEYNDELVREAIMRELARGGQVYYVYNKVESIAETAERIRKLVPSANVAYAHGKMREHELEDIMLDFINAEIDVLVSTTIVETGIDISNVNTILIHDADRFGLAQLYQLRGRVGRSNRCAYAFLLYRGGRLLREAAEKRLSTIREFTELGSGIKIAMKDLELRGAGNMLGLSQSGHMEAVGYDLYSKLLGKAIRELTGEAKRQLEFETSIEIALNAYLPEDYVKSENTRLSLYKRIAGIEDEEDMTDVQDEIIDRFGDIPIPVQSLLRVALIKALAHNAYITEISGDRDTLVFKMESRAPVDTMRIGPFLAEHKGDIRITSGDVVSFTYYDQRKHNTNDSEMLRTITDIIAEIKDLMEEET